MAGRLLAFGSRRVCRALMVSASLTLGAAIVWALQQIVLHGLPSPETMIEGAGWLLGRVPGVAASGGGGTGLSPLPPDADTGCMTTVRHDSMMRPHPGD